MVATIRPKDLPVVTAPTAADKVTLDGATTRSIAVEDLVGGIGIDKGWTTYTPTSAFSTPGTSVMGAVSGRWKKLGKTVFFSVDAIVTTVGTASGNWVIGLPTATNATSLGQTVGATGKEVITTGALLAIQGGSTTTVNVNKYDNTSLALAGNGSRIIFAGFYEAA